MAASKVTITINPFPSGSDTARRMQQIFGKIGVAAGDYPSGGLPLVWTGLEPIKTMPPPTPVKVIITDESDTPSGYIYQWDSTTGAMRIMGGSDGTPGDPFTEIATTTPSAVVAATIGFVAWFVKD